MTEEQREALLRREGTIGCEKCGQLWEVQLEEVRDEAEGHS